MNSASTSPMLKYEDMSKNITAIRFSDDGNRMFTAGEDMTARVWDCRSLRSNHSNNCVRTFQARSAINCVCLHPNQVSVQCCFIFLHVASI